MSNRTIVSGLVLFWILLCGALVYGLLGGRAVQIDKYSDVDRPAKIYPDYCSTVIPPNIAPLNFLVKEDGSYYFARIYSGKGDAIEVSSRSPKILIPVARWHELLEKNRAGELHFDIFVRADNQRWVRYRTITNRIAGEDIDGFLVYRRMHQTHTPIKGRIGIYQRNLSNFDELVVLDNRRYMCGCANCHSFCRKRPGEALLGVREDGYFTLFIEKNKVSKIHTKLGYTTWHPSGRLAAFSIDSLPIFFHSASKEYLDTFDLNSALAYFIVDSKTVRTSPKISRKDRLETWPVWSADGRYLYFCSSPMSWTPQTKVLPEGFDKIKYDLVRISYDIENDKWGELESVLSAQDTGLSISMPRTSPDGRWLTFCMCNYGYFTPWQPSSDLYVIDLNAARETGQYKYRRLDINSDESESWHSWSSNSRWIVFSSKREYGGFTRSYISYVDESGKVYKPLVLPQKDPAFYGCCLDAFNTPEFATVPIAAAGEKLSRVARGSAGISVEMPITMATPQADVAPDSNRDILR